MGSKKKFISRMEKCQDWVIWCKPKHARMLRLSGVKNPLGFWLYSGRKNQNMYILNGEHSFSYWSTMSGSYQTGSFHSENYVLKKAMKKCGDDFSLFDNISTVLEDTDYTDEKLRKYLLKADCFSVHSKNLYYRLKYYVPPLFVWGGQNVKISNGQVGTLIPTPNTKHYFEKWADLKVELADKTIVTVKAYEVERV